MLVLNLVTDQNGELIGLVTRHNILIAIHGAYFDFLIKTIENKNEQKLLEQKHNLWIAAYQIKYQDIANIISKVLAEGVETKEQLDFLEDKNCSLYQGFYKSKPLKAQELTAFVK